ncbi:baculoviral IAP repeat-containing protein 5 [Drosophila nasuta]|uniref:Baculoviral IAP repeat-containing protein 5 n=1 Tax=Drosophila albomicans TaxID=7291 RepID=A0A6P8XTC8_DROAB|nr:baculoviral IAP repeat-containing protein 5 [Drosophila albomicans]XP_060647494.1 baculoviral IAP repeat-containing protein 5 [Drosophila nasuta]
MHTTSTHDPRLDAFSKLNLLEKSRVDSFKDWPFPSNSTCSIAKMAEAGFYWTGTKRENDTATCFVCGKTLDGWESDDDPWKEHLKHAPQCEFVKLSCPEKDMTVDQFLKIFGTVVKNNIEKNIKNFKTKFLKDSEAKLNEFISKQP